MAGWYVLPPCPLWSRPLPALLMGGVVMVGALEVSWVGGCAGSFAGASCHVAESRGSTNLARRWWWGIVVAVLRVVGSFPDFVTGLFGGCLRAFEWGVFYSRLLPGPFWEGLFRDVLAPAPRAGVFAGFPFLDLGSLFCAVFAECDFT